MALAEPVPRPVLSVQNLSKSFKDKRGIVEACKNISFDVHKGEMVGLLGPNGAGKTTTIKCVLGLVKPDFGNITVEGLDCLKRPREAARNMAAVLEGARNVYWRLTVWENVTYFAGIHGISVKDGKEYFEHLLEVLKLEDKRNTEVRNLSSGYKQKTAVACTFAKMTPLVFLDEPTLGLDIESSYELREALKQFQAKEGRTVVVSSHDMKVIQEVCKRVVIIAGGRVVTDQSIEGLLDLFRKRSFKITVARNGSSLKEEDFRRFAGISISESADTIDIRASFKTPLEMYDLFSALKEHNAVLEGVMREELDLEQAFLEIVRRERENNVAHSA